MKKTITLLLATMICVSLQAQQVQPKDTDTVHIVMTVAELKALVQQIDKNCDSKTATKIITDFLYQKTLVFQPADKPKEIKPRN